MEAPIPVLQGVHVLVVCSGHAHEAHLGKELDSGGLFDRPVPLDGLNACEMWTLIPFRTEFST